MDRRSLEDLLALIELKNITRAAKRRNISQPAYSRRLISIERQYGVSLVNRTVRPAVPNNKLLSIRREIETALSDLRRLESSMSQSQGADKIVEIAVSYALACDIVPRALSKLQTPHLRHRILIRAANHPESLQKLMTEQVELMLAYETASHPLSFPTEFVDKVTLGVEKLVPVATPDLARDYVDTEPGGRSIPLIGYMTDFFLGRVLLQEILPNTRHNFIESFVASFTNSAVASARNGIGLAWVPYSLAREMIMTGSLSVLKSPLFPVVTMDIVMLRLRKRKADDLTSLWTELATCVTESAREEPGLSM